MLRYFHYIWGRTKKIKGGDAILRENFLNNLESAEDENGIVYAVDIYDSKEGNCWVSLSLESIVEDKLIIISTEKCDGFFNNPETYNSLGILRRVSETLDTDI